MAKEKEEEGAKFVRYFGPLLDALRALGGSPKADEAVDRVAEDLKIPDNVLNEVLSTIQLRAGNKKGAATSQPLQLFGAPGRI